MSENSNQEKSWTLAVENRLLQQIIRADTPEAAEAAVSYAEYLRWRGLDADNYPLFLKMLGVENRWVVDALMGPVDALDFFAQITPTRYLVHQCFRLLDKWDRGGIYPRTLLAVVGVLERAFSSSREGYKLYPLTVADLHNLAKQLDESEGQSHPLNRALLNLLENISELAGTGLSDDIDRLGRQAVKIKEAFLDNTKSLDDCLPDKVLTRADESLRPGAAPPRQTFIDGPLLKETQDDSPQPE